jgi:DNA topoisomerase-3
MKVIITETQSLAQSIAQALNIEAKPEKDGFLYGRGYSFIWIPEELICLSSPEDYGIIRFLKKDLPFIPVPLTLAVRQRKTAKGLVADPSAVRQVEVFRKIFERSEQIIVAMEPSEKGELTFRRLYSWLGCNKPYRRLWLRSTLPSAIREGLRNLQDGCLYDNLFAAADCRSQADFLVGVNASAAFSLSTGIAACRLGRLQMPTLAMVCKPLLEYRKFVPAHYYRLSLTLEKDGLYRQFAIPLPVSDKETAENVFTNLKACKTGTITKAETQSRVQQAPLLYNLTALQIDAFTRYGFTAQKTMEITERLYEKSLISFPCTDSRYIPACMFASIPKLLRQTACYSEFTDCLDVFEWNNLNNRSVEDDTESPHHALIPTGVYPGFLSADFKTIYRMVVARTLEAFAPDCRKEEMFIEAVAGETVAESKTSRILSKGWRAVLNLKEDSEKDEVDGQAGFPVFAVDENIPITGCSLVTGQTRFPTLHTEATLLEAMGKNSIGIPASRASIIESLIEWQCIERKTPFLRPAEKGLVIYNCTKEMRISDVETATGWERMLKDVGRGEQYPKTFLKVTEIFTRQATEEILTISPAKT